MNRMIVLFMAGLSFFSEKLPAQAAADTINKQQVEKIITYLASNELKGRVNYTKEQLQAADFISKEFDSYGLKPFPGLDNFYQPFRTSFGNRSEMVELKWNGNKLPDSLFYFFSPSPVQNTLTSDDFLVLQAYAPLSDSILYGNWRSQYNILIQVLISDSMSFSDAIKQVKVPAGTPSSVIVIAGHAAELKEVRVSPDKINMNSVLYNMIGILPGRNLTDEAVIFSAHYDHVDHGINGETGGIYNGANDDASGTTAVLELARYFSLRKDNERTIIFCLFAGEELGLLGSQAFVPLIKPENVKAVINIEMIGTHNVSGKNAFMLTGSGYSDLYKIMSRNLKKDNVRIDEQRSDPRNLFGRSDNYSFAREGIPAHTIMCSDDADPCYHQPCDDVKWIDMENMTRIIKAISTCTATLINGKDTPSRIKNL